MKYVIANWKMNMNQEKINTWLSQFELLMSEPFGVTIIIAPSFVHIPVVKFFAEKYRYIKIAAQDVSAQEMGAHTGEVGAEQLKEYCDYCIVGHSELDEDLTTKKAKAKICIEHGITPIICSKSPEIEWKNIDSRYLLAWEDPANISKGGVYNEKPVNEVETKMKELVEKEGHHNVIYGGSVNETNAIQLSKIGQVSGVLVGNASLNPKTFWEIVKSF